MKLVLGLAIALFISIPAFGQVPNSEQPGVVAKRFEQAASPKATSGVLIRLPESGLPAQLVRVSVRLVDIVVRGSTVYDDARLRATYAPYLDHTVSLATVYEVAQKITKLYGDDGYVLTRAIIPPQEIDPKHATITIQVSEAYVDRVVWPASIGHYRDFFAEYADKITAERPSNIRTVMRYLLLADDLPGIDVTSRFEASVANPRASTLVVEVTEKPVDLTAQIDNRGTEARGPWEYLGSATFNNLLGQHESFTATVAGATQTSELTYLALGYAQVLNSEGLTLFSDVNDSWGAPGTAALQALMFTSSSLEGDLGLSTPLIRSRDTNLTLSALAFLSNNEGQLLGAPNSDDRLRGIRFKATVDHADELNGVTQLTTTISQGFVGLGSSSNGDPLLSRQNGRVDFTKVEATLSRSQKLADGLSLYGAAQGQLALTPLLSPEECGYGGKDFGRGFDPSEITGDDCLLVSGELRFDPQLPNSPLTQTELYGFVDYGTVFRIAPASGTPTSDAGASAGAGLRLGNEHFSADLSAAKPLFGRSDQGWRAFLTATAKY